MACDRLRVGDHAGYSMHLYLPWSVRKVVRCKEA